MFSMETEFPLSAQTSLRCYMQNGMVIMEFSQLLDGSIRIAGESHSKGILSAHGGCNPHAQ